MTSQAHQDIFALKTAKNNTYIEIGAFQPMQWSNTYRLEMNGWKGFSIELFKSLKDIWDQFPERKNTVYWDDALTFDYVEALKEQGLPMHIGYLSCDIEPAENTFAALKTVIEQGITFDCITFEHDKYQSEIDYDPLVREYLLEKGYKVAVEDVYIVEKKETRYFETWFVRNDIDFETVDFNTWKKENVRLWRNK